MITLQGISKNYGQVTALDDLSFKVKKGEVFGLLGPNGAGKTTTLNIITQLTKPDAGTVFINDLDIKKFPLAAKQLMGVVPQDINVDMDLTIAENLMLYAMLHLVPTWREAVQKTVHHLGIAEKMNAPAQTLSGGMKRRLLIARALITSPAVLLMDEPTVGLDPQIRRHIWDEIRKLKLAGRTVLLTTHYIEEADMLCDRVGILARGRLVAIDSPKALKKKVGPFVLETTGPEGNTQRTYYQEEEAAKKAAIACCGQAVTIRPSNLEDVFISLTGEKIS